MLLPLVFAFALFAQSTPATPSPDALTLLNDVAQHYAQAKSYHIEAVKEQTFTNELSRNWQKTLVTAIVSPDGRYRYEGRSGSGAAVIVSDGTTKWDYHIHEQRYTQNAAADSSATGRHYIPQEEYPIQEAKMLMSEMCSLATRLKSAKLLKEETLKLNGHDVECYVVRFTDADYRKQPKFKIEDTVWIDKSRTVVVKTRNLTDSFSILPGSGAHIPISVDSTTIYTVVEFDQQPESAFRFAPPAEAKLVEAFPNPFPGSPLEDKPSELVGKPAPEAQLKKPDGTAVTMSSFRGKPVFIEFWATSCMPCVELMPDLKRLYAETVSKGLVWVSVDDDEDPDTATKFVSLEQLPWPNYHDADGLLGKAFHREGIPLGVLIGADGVVKFFGTGYEIGELRAAIAKLGPEFSSIAPMAK